MKPVLIGNSKTEEKMKKIFIIAAAVLAFAGCAKEAAQVERVTNDGKEYMVFNVVAHDDVVLDDTKATLSRGGVFGWEDGEPIYFVAIGGDMATGSYSASAGTITVEARDGGWLCASTAPFDSDDKIKDFGLAKGPVVWAKVEGSTLHFYHIGSVINIKFEDIPIDGFLEFWPNGGENWAGGNFTWDGNNVPELKGGGYDPIYIKRPITTADAGKDITLTVPNIPYNSGFTVALSGTSAKYFEKSTSNSFDLQFDIQGRPKLLNMKQLSVPTSTYTVAGETYFTAPDYNAEAGVLGTMWAPTESANDLVLDASGLYKKTYTNAPNGITFKIVKDHSWDEAWPVSNLYKGITCVNGEMTITFNAVSKEIEVTSRDLSYTVLGSAELFGIDWDVASVANEMEEVREGVFYKKIPDVKAGTYEFKVLANHDSNWNRSWGTPGASSNFSLTTTSDGDVEIYFYIANGFVRVVGFSDIYIVAGSISSIFNGKSWSENADENRMTIQDDGTYIKSFDVPSDIRDFGNYYGVEFKITNGTWSESWPGSNARFDANGVSNFSIIFNPVSKEVTATGITLE